MQTETTPTAILNIENSQIWAKMYWSKNAGVYGHQVVMHYNDGEGYKEWKSSGCGYCKLSSALDHLYTVIIKPKKYKCLGGDIAYYAGGTKHHKGGNYYSMSLNKFKNIDKLRG